MIPPMCNKFVAIFLIFGWVSLSGFDVVEDLGGLSAKTSLASAANDSLKFRGHAWGPLANNIVESANRIQSNDLALVNVAPTRFASDSLLEFRRHSQLHKLYQVFLI